MVEDVGDVTVYAKMCPLNRPLRAVGPHICGLVPHAGPALQQLLCMLVCFVDNKF